MAMLLSLAINNVRILTAICCWNEICLLSKKKQPVLLLCLSNSAPPPQPSTYTTTKGRCP
jgi:hypothetical protein